MYPTGRPPARRPRRFAVALVGVSVLLAQACTVGPSSRPDLALYGGPSAARPTGPEVDPTMPVGPGGSGQAAEFNGTWSPCPGYLSTDTEVTGFTFECNQLTVPMDHSEPRGTDTDLIVARARSPLAPPDAPPLVVVLGTAGPGAGLDSATTLADTVDLLPEDITSAFTIIGVDQRGSGAGLAVSCLLGPLERDLFGLDPTPGTVDALLATARRITFDCGDLTAPLTTFYNTVALADDLDLLRSALGVDTLDFLGSGYGATLGATYVDRYPGRIAHAVLDAPTDHLEPDSAVAAEQAVAYETVFAEFADDCAAAADCLLGDDPRATVQRLLTTASEGGAGLPMTAGQIRRLLTLALPDRGSWADLAAALADAVDGDPDAMTRMLDNLVMVEVSDWFLIDCNDSAERLTESELSAAMDAAAERAPMFGAYLVGLTGVCSLWPVPENGLAGVRGAGAPPILVLGGVEDPVAPYSGVQSVVTQLNSARLLSRQASDHGSFPRTECVTEAVQDYLLRSVVPSSSGLLCPG